jgi:hypothetical protein
MRSERMLREQLNYLRFRWFVGLNLDEEVWDGTVFTQNRERWLKADVARKVLPTGGEGSSSSGFEVG